jgi:hypothetical protein
MSHAQMNAEPMQRPQGSSGLLSGFIREIGPTQPKARRGFPAGRNFRVSISSID